MAAAKAGISTATAYRIESDPQLPSQKSTVRRRPDPLAGIFDEEVVPLLQQTPDLRPVTIFEELLRRHPELPPSVRRTLERRVRRWRACTVHRARSRPGGHLRAAPAARSARPVRLHRRHQPRRRRRRRAAGAPAVPLRLPYSGFEHADVVIGGESFSALSAGLQQALWTLGGAPQEHRTDSLSAAFRNLDRAAHDDLREGRRQAWLDNLDRLRESVAVKLEAIGDLDLAGPEEHRAAARLRTRLTPRVTPALPHA